MRLLTEVNYSRKSLDILILVQLTGANLFVPFICDPLNLNLFPPHVSGLAVGEWQGQRSRKAVVVVFLPPKVTAVSQFVLSVHADSVWSSQAERLSPNRLKKKKREKEERKNGVRCVAAFSDHCPVSEGRSSTLRLNRDPLPSPSPQLGSSWKTTEVFIRLRERNSEKRQRSFICDPFYLLQTLSLPWPLAYNMRINDAAMHLRRDQISTLSWNEGGGGGATCRAGGPQGPTRREAVLCQLH